MAGCQDRKLRLGGPGNQAEHQVVGQDLDVTILQALVSAMLGHAGFALTLIVDVICSVLASCVSSC